jgi:uncharacterized membrane protein
MFEYYSTLPWQDALAISICFFFFWGCYSMLMMWAIYSLIKRIVLAKHGKDHRHV